MKYCAQIETAIQLLAGLVPTPVLPRELTHLNKRLYLVVYPQKAWRFAYAECKMVAFVNQNVCSFLH